MNSNDRDYHVVSLTYQLRQFDNITYSNPPPISWQTEVFDGKLEDGVLVCEMKAHFASQPEARQAVEPHLRAWEVNAALERNRDEFVLDFNRSLIIDRSPPPTGTNIMPSILVTDSATLSGELVTVTREYIKYPVPPQRFRLTPDAATLWHRYGMYLDGREPLLSMAYFCLTVLEVAASSLEGKSSRKKAAAKYNISYPVLEKIGRLSGERGTFETARKAESVSGGPLTDQEHNWLIEAIKTLIRRVGEHEPGSSLPQITMADLPPLP